MENQPLISVIVPIYNVEQYLDRCITSIVNQIYKNLEIILVDDGSPDNCPKMCDNWAEKDERIKVIHKENGGLSDARNAGLRIAQGDYIAFADSDDWVEENYIHYLYQATMKSDSDMSACEVRSVRDGENVLPIDDMLCDIGVYMPEQALAQLLQGKGFRAVAWNKLYKSGLIKNETFEVGKLHEDEFFTYRIIDKCRRLAFVDIPLYNYRQRAGSIMSYWNERHLDAFDAVLLRINLLKEKYPQLYIKDKATFCISCSNTYILANKSKNSNKTKKRIKWYRKQISFSFKEISYYSLKDRIYIMGSKPCFIGFFSKIRSLRGIE